MRISDWSSDVCSSDLKRRDIDLPREHRSQCVRHLVNRKILWNIAVDARAKRVEHHLAVPGRGDYDDANLGVFDAQVAQAFALAHSRQAEIDRYKVDRSPRPHGGDDGRKVPGFDQMR